MTNELDGEIFQWLSIAKGDTPGHPFRGNQYAQIAAEHADEHREVAAQHMERANALARSAGQHLQFDGDAQLAQSTLDKANEHEAAANAHLEAAKAWDGVVQSGDTAEANAAQALSTKAYESTIGKSVGEISAESDDQTLEFYTLEKSRRSESDDDEEDDDTNNHLFGMYARD